MWNQLDRLDKWLARAMTARLKGKSPFVWLIVLLTVAGAIICLAAKCPTAVLGLTLLSVAGLLERLSRVPTSWAMLLAAVGAIAASVGIATQIDETGVSDVTWAMFGMLCGFICVSAWRWHRNATALAASIRSGPCPTCERYKGV